MVYRHSAFYSPLLATISAEFLEEEGLRSTYQVKRRDRNLYDMFASGEVDIMQAAVSTSWDPLSRGVSNIPMHFAQINQRDGFFIVGRQRAARFDWKSLEGARLVADHSQQPLAMLRYAMHHAGVDWSRIHLVNAGTPESMETSFRGGTGDFIHLQGPAAQQIEVDGAGTVLACVGEALPNLAFSSLMATRQFLATPKAEAFMRAYRRALHWVNSSEARMVARALSSHFPEHAESALSAAIEAYQKLKTWREDPAIPEDQYAVSMDAFLFSGVFKRRFPYTDVVVSPPGL